MEQSWNGLLPNLDLEAVSLKDTRAKIVGEAAWRSWPV